MPQWQTVQIIESKLLRVHADRQPHPINLKRQACFKLVWEGPRKCRHPWGWRGLGLYSLLAASSLLLGNSPVCCLHLLEVRQRREFWPSFYNQLPNEQVCLGLPWTLTLRRELSPPWALESISSGWAVQERQRQRCIWALILMSLSQEVVCGLLPRVPSSSLSQTGSVYWSTLLYPWLHCPHYCANLDLSWSKKMANYSQCHSPSLQVGFTLGCHIQVPARFLPILCNCPQTLSLQCKVRMGSC